MVRERTKTILLISVILFAVLASIAYFIYDTKSARGNNGEGNLPSQILKNLNLFQNPEVVENIYFGNESAPITITAFLSFDSEPSKFFLKEIFPRLKEDYINSGMIKYYPKNYITEDDIEQRNDNLKYAVALSCINKLDKEKYYPIYIDLFNEGIIKIKDTLNRNEIPITEFLDCADLKNFNFDQLYKEADEIENLGILGINQRFYIGVMGRDNTVLDGIPSYQKFEKTIRTYEIQVGN